MFRLTIGEFIDREDYSDITDALCLYVIREGATVLYVGQSANVIGRLWQHFGPPLGYSCGFRGKFDDIGRFVVANLPQSRSWQIDLLSLEDCDNYLVFHIPHNDVNIVESYLIGLLAPCLNRINNRKALSDRLSDYSQPWKISAEQWPEI